MARKRYTMPSSGGGIVRYNDEYKSKIMLAPGNVIFLIILLVLLIIILNAYGARILGII